MAFSSNGGDGTLTVVREEEPGRFDVVATIPTQPGARTMTIDPKTHRIYLSAATPAPAPAADRRARRERERGGSGAEHGAGVIRGPRRRRLTTHRNCAFFATSTATANLSPC